MNLRVFYLTRRGLSDGYYLTRRGISDGYIFNISILTPLTNNICEPDFQKSHRR